MSQIPVAEAKLYLHRNNWRLHGLKDALRLQPDASGTSQVSEKTSLPSSSSSMFCQVRVDEQDVENILLSIFYQVCASIQERRVFSALSCGHAFCRGCWEQHFDLQIRAGLATGLACMSAGCSAAAPESFVLTHVGPEGQARCVRRLSICDVTQMFCRTSSLVIGTPAWPSRSWSAPIQCSAFALGRTAGQSLRPRRLVQRSVSAPPASSLFGSLQFRACQGILLKRLLLIAFSAAVTTTLPPTATQ